MTLLLSLCLAATAAAAPPTTPMSPMSIAEYKTALKRHVHQVAEPMLEILGKKRVAILIGVIGKCRKTAAFKTCMKKNKPEECMTALTCPFTSPEEQALIAKNNTTWEARYANVKPSFNDKLEGWRRRFAIGTLNKLVDQHNAVVQPSPPSPAEIQAVFTKCGSAGTTADRALVVCFHDMEERDFEDKAKDIEKRHEALKTFVDKTLMERVDGFQDAKK